MLFVLPGLMMLASALGWGKTCLEGRTDLESLPSHIGMEGKSEKTTFPLRCDTVEVPAGKKTVIDAGMFVYFVKPNPANLIHVYGTLVLRGSKEHYVLLAGGRNSKTNMPEPSKALWGGIVVEPEGRLEMEFAGFHGAPTPITAFSQNVKIVNSFFTNSTALIKPDGNLLELDPQFAAINYLDLSAAPTEEVQRVPPKATGEKNAGASRNTTPNDTLSQSEKSKLLAQKQKGFWKRSSTWIGSGAILVAAVGGYFLLQPDNPTSPVQVTPSAKGMDSLPPVPNLSP